MEPFRAIVVVDLVNAVANGFDRLGPDISVEHAIVDGFFDVMGFDIV